MAHGWVTVRCSAVPPPGVSGLPAPATGRVSATRPPRCGRVPGAEGRGAARWGPPARPPVCRLSPRASAHASRPAVLPAHVPEDVQPPRGPGTPRRDGAEPSASGEARALPRAAGGAAPARGGAAGARGRGARWRAGLPPWAQDGTARRSVRPHDPADQPACESGQTKAQPGHKGRRVTAGLLLLCRSDPSGGRLHAPPRAAAPPSPWPAGRRWRQARGGLAGTLPAGASLRPTKKPRGPARTLHQHRAHQARPRRRRLEPGNRSGQRWRVGKARSR